MLKWTDSLRPRAHQVFSVIYAKQSYYFGPCSNHQPTDSLFSHIQPLAAFLFKFVMHLHRWPAFQSALTFYIYVYLKQYLQAYIQEENIQLWKVLVIEAGSSKLWQFVEGDGRRLGFYNPFAVIKYLFRCSRRSSPEAGWYVKELPGIGGV